jgi:hypothetical protein
VQGERYGSILSSICRYSVFAEKFIEEAVFFTLYVLDTFVKNQLAIAA